MAENFAATSGLDVEVDSEGDVLKLPMKVEAALLRIAQERWATWSNIRRQHVRALP